MGKGREGKGERRGGRGEEARRGEGKRAWNPPLLFKWPIPHTHHFGVCQIVQSVMDCCEVRPTSRVEFPAGTHDLIAAVCVCVCVCVWYVCVWRRVLQ